MQEAEKPKARRRGRRPDLPWPDIRAAYEAGETSWTSLGRKFGGGRPIRRQTIAKHAMDENWTVRRTAQAEVHARAGAKIIDIATKRAIAQMGGEAAIDAQASTIAAELRSQGSIATKLSQAAEMVLDDFLAGNIEPGDGQNKADTLASIAGAIMQSFKAARLIHGIVDGKPSTNESNADTEPGKLYTIAVRPVVVEEACS